MFDVGIMLNPPVSNGSAGWVWRKMCWTSSHSVSQSCQSYVTRKDNLPDSDGYWIRRSDQQQMFFCRQQIPAYRWTKLWRTRKWTTNSASFAAAAPLVSAAASCAGSHCQRMAGQSWGGWLTYRKIMKIGFSPRSCLWNLGKMIVSFRM